MARDNKITMPSSSAGITRYFEEFKSNITLKPTHVIILAVIIMAIIIFLNIKGMALLGIE